MRNRIRMEKGWWFLVGEFIVVVLGILVALQVENWNSDGKDRILAKQYQTSLKESLEQDRVLFGWATRTLEGIDSSMEIILTALENDQLEFGPKEVGQLDQFRNWFFIMNRRAAFDDLYNSGRLNLLSNDQNFITDISTYYEYCGLVKRLDDTYIQKQTMFLGVLLKEIPFKERYWNVPPDVAKTMGNMASFIRGTVNNHLGHYQTILNINKALTEELEAEI